MLRYCMSLTLLSLVAELNLHVVDCASLPSAAVPVSSGTQMLSSSFVRQFSGRQSFHGVPSQSGSVTTAGRSAGRTNNLQTIANRCNLSLTYYSQSSP